MFEPLKSGMETPELVKCPDGHFYHAIYGLGPYIADYPEQVWLACIVQGWCPKYADILTSVPSDAYLSVDVVLIPRIWMRQVHNVEPEH